MPLKRRPLDRESGAVRDASLVVIASEDTYAVQQYFAKFQARRVQFQVLPTRDSMSAPEAVLKRLDEYRDNYQLGPGDELWLCIDRDHWAEDNHVANLVQVMQKCSQKSYRVAISNPCFDFWVLLHFQDPPAEGFRNCGEVTEVLKKIIPGYCKKSIGTLSISVDQVEQAIVRASGVKIADRLSPDAPSTEMHLIVESLRVKEAIRLKEER